MISGNVPTHLTVGARTGFLTALKEQVYPWQRVAAPINIGAKSIDLVDLGAAPMPMEDATPQLQDFIEKSLTVKPRDWSLYVWISYNALQDDQTGTLNQKVRSAGRNFQRHLNNRVFTVLDAGDASTYGLCYDGLSFFNDSHVDKGASYTTTQDNNLANNFSADNFETAYVAAENFKDDQGEETGYNYNLIVTSPALRREAGQISTNPMLYDAAATTNQTNPWAGKVDLIVSPKMGAAAYVLIAGSEATKPLGVVMREQPNLQDAWFDPKQPGGGHYIFKFYARYECVYLDWRMAIMGQT